MATWLLLWPYASQPFKKFETKLNPCSNPQFKPLSNHTYNLETNLYYQYASFSVSVSQSILFLFLSGWLTSKGRILGHKKFLLSYKKVNRGGWVKISKCAWVCERVCVSACVRVRACMCKRESENVGWISVCVDIWSRKSASSFEAQSVTELKSFRKSSFAKFDFA